MPILTLRGGKTARIDQKTAEKIAEMKWGINGSRPTAEPHDMIDIEKVGKFEVQDVRNILNEDIEDETALKNNEKYYKNIQTCLPRRNEVKNWSPIQKAERMLKTYCYLAYRAKGNKGDAKDVMFQDPLYSNLMKPLVEYFENNPDKFNAPREVYLDKITSQPCDLPSLDGWKTFNQLR
jgi:hypothetical protein